MKKVFFVLAITLCLSRTLWAQETSIGITTGFGHSWLSGTDGQTLFHPAWNIGGTFMYSTAMHWGFGFDIKYSMEGNHVRRKPTDDTYWNNIDYIRIPFRVTYFFNTLDNPIRPKVSLAPTMGFLAASRFKAYDTDGHQYANFSNTSDINGFDFGMTLAAGANFKIQEKMWFTAELAYYNGFANMAKLGDTQLNRNVGVNVGLTYGIGR